VTGATPTAEFASLVYGADGVALDDPVEACHEASRLYPHVAPGRLTSMLALGQSPALQETVARSSRTLNHRPGLDLPRVALPPTPWPALLRERRSRTESERRALPVGHLAALLEASYAALPREPGLLLRRPVPSAGALYPLELYVLSLAVEGVHTVVAHYDPFRHRLELLGALDEGALRDCIVDPGLIDGAAAMIVITGMFWRSRFKYGARGYRFTLLEAGHVSQNAVLAAAALGLAALPLGGFYDRRLEALVGADGLDEAAVCALVLGGSR
jgi:SagB-type dehydrogenase family enzyme